MVFRANSCHAQCIQTQKTYSISLIPTARHKEKPFSRGFQALSKAALAKRSRSSLPSKTPQKGSKKKTEVAVKTFASEVATRACWNNADLPAASQAEASLFSGDLVKIVPVEVHRNFPPCVHFNVNFIDYFRAATAAPLFGLACSTHRWILVNYFA